MTKRVHTVLMGNENAKTCFYLPNPPILPKGWVHTDKNAVDAVITLNGNHWRKIFTIMAKLVTLADDWKSYRDQQLLKSDEQILIGSERLSVTAKQHIIVGAVSASKLSISVDDPSFVALEESGKIYLNHLDTFITPYLDYRQFPNALIEHMKPHLNSD
ncbi:hypothetical protein FM038_25565 [Shewanella eurypsychrophilus]|uniref:Uncharacterized protein n=1 Tax=Shewanella eurypsychrophilus TaxID=2593656 RepID=A0ABX8S553_9GAMM|nr:MULTISPECIES: hypothetical protein [Shewanella]QFU23230.1 hypothetical protein FS418_16060 [Shewanella sp. YLB-09]QXP44823.1 hypothetical protein FM038_25565 [Shewanella eurypsychrophilus]